MIYICLAIIIIGALSKYVYEKKTKFYSSGITFFCDFTVLLGVSVLTVSVSAMIYYNAGTNGKYQQKIEDYNYLMNKIDNDISDDVSKIFLREQIHAWNRDIVYNKVNQRDFILGPFIPNIYDNLQTIDYNVVFKEKKNTYYNDFINVKSILR